MLMPMNEVMLFEIDPVAASSALEMMGKIRSEVRWPLVPLAAENEPGPREVLLKYDVLER